ncbi:unnamed protein product [Owenia fusiformis]|uniref:Uncharacterized protein n=1 Tax=Owenia fusiformis TaxID=6347 RepID=A0A8J1XUD8_OWEFU|nr:unnamed protein product [Owenia fusiformis]
MMAERNPEISRKTCSVWQAEGYGTGHRAINPNAQDSPLIVFCDMSTTPAGLSLEHDKMTTGIISGPGCNTVACNSIGTLVYFTSSLDRLMEVLDITSDCKQHVRYDCYHSGMDNTRWMTHNDSQRAYWGGHPSGEFDKMQCGCKANNSCVTSPGCPPGWEIYESNCYFFGDTSQSWNDSRTRCQQEEADLISITSIEERNFITSHVMQKGGEHWLGLLRDGAYRRHRWLDGRILDSSLAYWDSGEPNYGPNEFCVHTKADANGRWNDLTCSSEKLYICKKELRSQGACNCDSNLDNWLVDEGDLVAATVPGPEKELPIKEVAFGRFSRSDSIGNYTIGPAVCQEKVRGCPALAGLPDSTNNISSLGHIAGDVVIFTCNVGHEPQSLSATCLSDGTWSLPNQSCQRKNCGPPGTSRNTNMVSNGTEFGDIAQYTCKQAYRYDRSQGGSEEIVCQADGTWSDVPISCKPGFVAFSLTHSLRTWSTPNTNVKFDNVELNKGGGYNVTTGEFVCPVSGHYYIDYNLQSFSTGGTDDGFDAYLRINGNNRRRIFQMSFLTEPNRGSNSLVTHLKTGDRVAVYVTENYFITMDIRSSFNGYLVHADEENETA